MAMRTLLLTRPEKSAERFAARLSAAARSEVNVVISPLMRIEPTGAAWNRDVTAVIFSSVNGVTCAGSGDGRPAYCVGLQTAKAAKQANWQVLETAETARALIDLLALDPCKGPLVHLAGRHRRGDIAENLTQLGIQTRVLTLYDQHLQNLSADAIQALKLPTIAPLFSPRTAMQLARQDADLRQIHAIALSSPVAEALSNSFPGKCDTLSAPTGDLMLKAVEKLCLRTTIP